jgi:hypothetical protein
MMTPDEQVDRFVGLFAGRNDVYGTWEGGCVRDTVTRHHYTKHLTSGPFIGTYPTMGELCSWGCVDIDGKDFDHRWDEMRALARNIQTALAVKHVHAHIERTKNGYHIWVFPEVAVTAASMRRCLLAACQVVEYKPKEVNPKQEAASVDHIGNYVRLPYPGGMVDTPSERYFFDENDFQLSLEAFLETVQTTVQADIDAIAALWVPPPKVEVGVADVAVDALHPLLPPLAFIIWRDGPLGGHDRSSTLAHLSHLMAEGGIPVDSAMTLLIDADRRWGKFAGREDATEQLSRILSKAYSEHLA